MDTIFTADKYIRYDMGDETVYVGFDTFEDAETAAQALNGKIVEVAFTDGNDNPAISNRAGLVANRKHFYAEAGPGYKIMHSGDEGFQEIADQLMKRESDLEERAPEEKLITDTEAQVSENSVIVLKDGNFNHVTSRERIKFLKHANVYEIGVLIPNN